MSGIARSYVEVPPGPALAYAQQGARTGRRDVVLIHGGMSAMDDPMVGLGDALAAERRVTAFDRPGHGWSQREALVGDCWRQAELLRAASQRLGIERPVLVGHSFGGTVAMCWALQFPQDCAGVVALAPIALPELRLEHLLFAPRATPGGAWMNLAINATMDRVVLPTLWRAMFLPQAMPDAFERNFPFERASSAAHTETYGEDALSINGALARAAANYWRCETSVQVLAGDRDVVVNNSLHGRFLAAAAPKGSFRSLPGLGHMTHYFAPEAIAEAVRATGD